MLFWSHELLYRILYMRYYCIWYRFSEELHWCAILSRIAGLFMNGCLILYLSVEGPHWNPSMIYKGPLKPLELQIRCCIMAPPETPRTSRQYGTEGFKGGMVLRPTWIKDTSERWSVGTVSITKIFFVRVKVNNFQGRKEN